MKFTIAKIDAEPVVRCENQKAREKNNESENDAFYAYQQPDKNENYPQENDHS